jgi:hypothetical protein
VAPASLAPPALGYIAPHAREIRMPNLPASSVFDAATAASAVSPSGVAEPATVPVPRTRR